VSKHRGRIAAAVATLVVGGGAAWWVVASGDEESEEVCETTVYEGCPQRWDYLTNPDP
jgi:hypothetical protein